MLMQAMKSAGPKMIVSMRGDAAAMASTSTRPLAFSICASMPMRPTSSPQRLLDLGQQQVQRVHLGRDCTLGSITASRFAPAPSTTAITSP